MKDGFHVFLETVSCPIKLSRAIELILRYKQINIESTKIINHLLIIVIGFSVTYLMFLGYQPS